MPLPCSGTWWWNLRMARCVFNRSTRKTWAWWARTGLSTSPTTTKSPDPHQIQLWRQVHSNIHDNHYGDLTHISSSYDDKYLFTVGADRNFFTFEFMEQEEIEEEIAAAKAKMPSAKVGRGGILRELDVKRNITGFVQFHFQLTCN